MEVGQQPDAEEDVARGVIPSPQKARVSIYERLMARLGIGPGSSKPAAEPDAPSSRRPIESPSPLCFGVPGVSDARTSQAHYTLMASLDEEPTICEGTTTQNSLLQSTAMPEWFIPRNQLRVEKGECLGRGGFGHVFRAKWGSSDVVVKEMGLAGDGESKTSFFSFMSPSTPSDKPSDDPATVAKRENLLPLRRVPHWPMFVCEYATNGTLDKYLERHTGELWQKLYEAVLGVQYIHSRCLIVHGDLKCDNIMVGSDGKSKVTDFGLSSALDQVDDRTGKISGAVQWVAPECLGKERVSPSFESDIYSLGMCIIEAMRVVEAKLLNKDPEEFSRYPWGSLDHLAVVHHVTKLRALPLRPTICTDEQWTLVEKMCAFEPSKRISMASVVDNLRRIAEQEAATNQPALLRENQLLLLSAFQDGETIRLWSEIERIVSDHGVTVLQYQMFQELEVFHVRLEQSSHQWQLLQRFHETLVDYHCAIQAEAVQTHILRLSSKRATGNTMQALHRRIDFLWEMIGDPDHNGRVREKQREEQRKIQLKLFVSEVSQASLALSTLGSTEDRRAMLALLKAELAMGDSEYSASQLVAMQKAHDEIAQSSGSDLLATAPKWFLPWYELQIDNRAEVGRGSSGRVYRGTWLNSEVVVKQVELSTSADSTPFNWCTSLETHLQREEAMAMFRREADIWFGLSHPHVVRLFGACNVGDPFFVSEYAPNGTLVNYVRSLPDQRWQKLLEASLGVQYLHNRGIIHGDLKCDNIVMGCGDKAKITDFGLSALANCANEERPQVTGAWHWAAPECLVGERSTFESDIYSLGMCVVEVMRIAETRLLEKNEREFPPLPWGLLDDAMEKYRLARSGGLPQRPTICSDDEWALVERMCTFDSSKRITIGAAVEQLERLVLHLKLHPGYAESDRPRLQISCPSRNVQCDRAVSGDEDDSAFAA